LGTQDINKTMPAGRDSQPRIGFQRSTT